MKTFIDRYKVDIILTLVLALVVIGMATYKPHSDLLSLREKAKQANIKRVNVALAGYETIYTPEEATKLSKDVVLGTVIEVKPSSWNSVDRKRPKDMKFNHLGGPRIEPDENGNVPMIYTPVVISVQKTLKGTKNKTIMIKMMGGEVDGDSITVGNEHRLKVGDQVMLFTDYTFKEDNGDTLDVPRYIYKIDDGEAKHGDDSIALSELETRVVSVK
ncbi:MAG: hypothetical protein QME41_09970 [Actinomycetota bacterium]|nr:hypothetical protein [Actinomycetota bacterium]